LVYFLQLHHNALYKKHKVPLISLYKNGPIFKPSGECVTFGDFSSEQHMNDLKILLLVLNLRIYL